jgi:hypothetical protein
MKHCGKGAAQFQAEAVEARRAMTRTSASLWAEKLEREEQIEALKETWRSVLPKPAPKPVQELEPPPPVDPPEEVEPVFKDEWLADPVKRGPGRPRKIS